MTSTVETLALEFSQGLRSYLTDEQMAEVLRLNLAEISLGICHSHDFCDANMFLHEVFMKYGMNPVEEGGMVSVVNQLDGLIFTIGDGGNRDCDDGGGIKRNGAGISTGAVLFVV